jgi:hypothetical protein
MNLDYITINGLDANTKKRIEDDLAKSGYTGSKSAYVVALMNDGLDKREAIRGVTSEQDFQSLYAKASSIEEKLGEVSSRQCESGAGMEVYKILAVETYRLLELLGGFDGARPRRDRQGAEGRPADQPALFREKEIKKPMATTPNVVVRMHYYDLKDRRPGLLFVRQGG